MFEKNSGNIFEILEKQKRSENVIKYYLILTF